VAGALGLANQKLYHAAILIRLLSAERQREQVSVSVLMEAVGEPARQHLCAAYGWFLVALADLSGIPDTPPNNVSQLAADLELAEPLRGELVELRQLEDRGWLSGLLTARRHGSASGQGSGQGISVVEQAWDDNQLRLWHRELEQLIDRLSHGLEEW
jgi:hypothetical protein